MVFQVLCAQCNVVCTAHWCYVRSALTCFLVQGAAYVGKEVGRADGEGTSAQFEQLFDGIVRQTGYVYVIGM